MPDNGIAPADIEEKPISSLEEAETGKQGGRPDYYEAPNRELVFPGCVRRTLVMRRRWMWMAGLGLLTGPLGAPAWSQSDPSNPAPATRTARLGLPLAVTEGASACPSSAPRHIVSPSVMPTGYALSASDPSMSRGGEAVPVPAPGAAPIPATVLPGDGLIMPGTPIAAVIPSVQPPSVAGGVPAPATFTTRSGPSSYASSPLPIPMSYPDGVQLPAVGGPGQTGMIGLPTVLPMPMVWGGSQTLATQTPGSPIPHVTESRHSMAVPPPGSSSATSPASPPMTTYVPTLPTTHWALAPLGLEPPLYTSAGLEALQRLSAPSKYYASAEFLLWWTKSAHLPPLLTTSSPQFQGIPGLGDTRVLFGGNFGNTLHAGGRFSIGRWFGDDQIRGVEGRLFFLGRTDSTFAVTSAEYPVLARPFFNINTPIGPLSEIIAAPGRGVGAAVIDLQNDVWGAEVNYRRNLWRSCCARLDALMGYRYFGMKERLGITESFISTGPNPVRINGIPVISGTISDVFRAENHFHGGQIGLAWEHRWGLWTFDARATVAFGNVTQLGEIDGGQTLLLANGQTLRYAGGLLALPNANIGRYTHNQFAVLPEVGVNLGYQLTPHMRLYVGYNFIYLGNALRPERMIDTTIDIARIPNFVVPGGGTTPVAGLPRPAPLFRTNDFFVQGISFGLEFRW